MDNGKCIDSAVSQRVSSGRSEICVTGARKPMAEKGKKAAAPRGVVTGHLERISSALFARHKDVSTGVLGDKRSVTVGA